MELALEPAAALVPLTEQPARCLFCLQSSENARLTFSNLSAFYATFGGCGLGHHLSENELCGWVCAYCWTRSVQCLKFMQCARAAEIALSNISMYPSVEVQECKFYNLTRFRLENTEHARGSDAPTPPHDTPPAPVKPKTNSQISEPTEPTPQSETGCINDARELVSDPFNDPVNTTDRTVVELCSDQCDSVNPADINVGCELNSGVDNPEATPAGDNKAQSESDSDSSSASSSDIDSDMSLGPKVYRIRRGESGRNVRHRRAVFRERKVEQLRMLFIEPIRFSIEEQRSELARKKTTQKYLKSRFKCDKCGAGHSEEEAHVAHVNKWHHESAGEFECEICRYRFQTTTLLNNHLMEHTRRWRCLKCGAVIARRTNCELHHAKCIGATPAQCHLCGKSFMSDFHLQRHVQRTHANTRVYACDECNATFRYRTSLKSHIAQVHRKLRPFECDICGKKSGCASSHQMHVKTHAPAVRARETYCADCDRYFKSAHTLQHHLRRSQRHVSKDTFTHVCSVCSERFQEPSYLKHHIRRVHLKVKTHPCDHCDKSYYTATSLATHVRNVHRPDVRTRDHVCSECGKAFLGKNHLQNHITAVHKKERPYACDICGATFGFRSALFTHNKLKHKMQTQRGLARAHAGMAASASGGTAPADQLALYVDQHMACVRQ